MEDVTVTKSKYPNLHIHAIAAIGENNQIGLNGLLPWHYPSDLELFKKTIEDKLIIVGENTYKGMPKKIFKTCKVIVISKELEESEYIEYVASSLEDALNIANDSDYDDVWICGGEMVYNEALKQDHINTLHITHIPYDGLADRFFPSFITKIKSIPVTKIIKDEKNNTNIIYREYVLNYQAGQPRASIPYKPSLSTGSWRGLGTKSDFINQYNRRQLVSAITSELNENMKDVITANVINNENTRGIIYNKIYDTLSSTCERGLLTSEQANLIRPTVTNIDNESLLVTLDVPCGIIGENDSVIQMRLKEEV